MIATAIAWSLRHRRRGFSSALVGIVGGVALVAPSVAWHVHRLHSGEIPRLLARHSAATVVIKLVRDPVSATTATDLLIVDATVVRVDDGGWRGADAPVLVLVRDPMWRDLLPGQRIRVDARLEPPRRGDDVAAVVLVSGASTLVGRPPWWQRIAGRARESLRSACAPLPADARGLLPSLVDGDTSRVPADLHTDMQVAGLSHLEAVSGENLSVVLAVALSVTRGVGLRRRARVIGSAAALAGFVILARPSPSVQRAAVMSGVTLIAMFSGRRASGVSTLPVAVIALLVLDPFLARAVGFILSVSATAGIVVLAPGWTRRLQTWVPRPLAIAVAVSAAAQLACTPVLVLAFGQLTPYAMPANVLAAPAVVPATILGVISAVAALASPAAAAPTVWLGALPTVLLGWIARFFASLPGAPAALGPVPAVVVAAGAGMLLIWAARFRVASGDRAIL